MDSDESDDSKSPRPLGLLGGCRLKPNNVQSESLQNSMLCHVAEMDIHWPHPF